MRKSCYLVFSLLILLIAPVFVQAQATKDKDTDRQNRLKELAERRQRIENMNNRNDMLESLENYDRTDNVANAAKERKLEIARNLKQLSETSHNLLANLKTPSENCLKETAKMADKIAKLSKHLRDNLDLADSKEKVELQELPAETERMEQLQQMAATVVELVEKVKLGQSNNSVDAKLIEQTSDCLHKIQSHAVNMRTIARGKR